MSDFYTEADYENSVIELFQNMGYRYVYAPDLERDFRSPLYEEELEEAIHRINSDMPEEALADAIYKLKNFENAELVLIGDGPLRKEIEDEIHQLKLENVVKILGVRSDIAQLTQMLDVLAFPSLYEGLPVTLIECQAAGLPCICSDVITKNVDITGLCDFVPLNDLQKWCKAILSCVGTKRENTTEKIMQAGYDITTTARWIEEFYSEKSKR